MTELTPQKDIEQKVSVVDSWAKHLSETSVAGKIDRGVLRAVLEAFGANFEISKEALKALGKDEYTNRARAQAMKEVWGERFELYKDWTVRFIEVSEKATGRQLPALEKSGRKNAGMLGFLGELTAYAVGNDETYPFGTFFIKNERASS